MHQLNGIRDRPYELVKLVVINDQRGRNFENHEIVSTDLGQDAVIPEKPHDQNLSEHARVDFQKRLERDAQAQFPRSGELNSAHQANAANTSFYPIDPRGLADFDMPIDRQGLFGVPARPSGV